MKNGFSLVELLICIALLVIITGISLNQCSFLKRFVLQTEVQKLAAICTTQQQKALISGTNKKIIFHPASQSYQVDSLVCTLSPTIQFGAPPGAQGPPSLPTKEITKPISWHDNTIVFHTSGMVQPGTVYLQSPSTKQAWALSFGVGNVSFLRKYRYDGTWQYIR